MIDWLLAKRLAAFLGGGGDAPHPRGDLVAMADQGAARVIAYTGMEPRGQLPPAEGIGRREWIGVNAEGIRAMLDPALQRAGRHLGAVGTTQRLGAELALTGEVAVVLGFMSQRVLGQYELVMLDAQRPPRLLFVLPNLGAAVRNLAVSESEFLTWVALHEVTHAVQFGAVPWLREHIAGLLRVLLARLEASLESSRTLRLPARADVRRVGRALRSGDFMGMLLPEPERAAVDRLQATMSVIEGHAEHVMDAVGEEMLPSLAKLRSALEHRRRNQPPLVRILSRLLGLELKMRQYERGKAFCDAVAREGGVSALHAVWREPDALPSLGELAMRAWMARVL
jgi:coenzyme F420 biosynthesis associated uncharacterized protein